MLISEIPNQHPPITCVYHSVHTFRLPVLRRGLLALTRQRAGVRDAGWGGGGVGGWTFNSNTVSVLEMFVVRADRRVGDGLWLLTLLCSLARAPKDTRVDERAGYRSEGSLVLRLVPVHGHPLALPAELAVCAWGDWPVAHIIR